MLVNDVNKAHVIVKWMLGVTFLLWTVCSVLNVAGQRLLFYAEGQEELYDYWMPRMCLEQGYTTAKSSDYGLRETDQGERGSLAGTAIEYSDWYRPQDGKRIFITGRVDKVYPAFAILPLRFFPATRLGGYLWTTSCGVVFLLGLLLCARGKLWPLVFAGSMPFLFSFERGNPIWLTAAFVSVFLAWWDSEQTGRRFVAAMCLGMATVMKISPVCLGLLYIAKWVKILRKGSRADGQQGASLLGEIIVSAVTCLLLFFIPWLWVREGFAGIPMMLQNAAHHADYVLRTADFGLVQIWRTIRMVFGLDVGSAWPGMVAVGYMSRLLGVLAVLRGAWKEDFLLLIGGMLLFAGNMYYYAALYLLPVFILQPPHDRFSILLWCIMLCPLQVVAMGHPGNAVLCNLAVITLMGLHVIWGWKDLTRFGKVASSTSTET